MSKKQSDDFGVIFEKTCQGRSEEQILGWRRALTDAATVVGDAEDSRNWYFPIIDASSSFSSFVLLCHHFC